MRISAAIGFILLTVVPVLADPIDNPGNFVWDTGTGDLEFNKSAKITRQVGTITSGLDIDLDSQGNITFNFISFASVTIAPYTVTFLVSAGGSNGKILANDPGYNSTFDLSVRIRVTGNGITGTGCTTASAVRDFEGAYQYNGLTDAGGLDIYSGTGGSVGGATGWLTIPALASGCAGQESTINSLLGLGVSGESLNVARLGANMSSGAPRGS